MFTIIKRTINVLTSAVFILVYPRFSFLVLRIQEFQTQVKCEVRLNLSKLSLKLVLIASIIAYRACGSVLSTDTNRFTEIMEALPEC
jgi:hypothetical protein